MQRRQLLRCLPCLALMGQVLATPSDQQAPWAADMPQARLLGEGDFRWFGLRIYRAQLWASPSWPMTSPAKGEAVWQAHPWLLHIEYARAISREQFVKATMDEIERIQGGKYSEQQLANWSAALRNIWRDVEAGDVLSAWYQPGRGCRFYDGTGALGELVDPDFAQAFFAIWLDPNTRDARLRRQLLGQAS